MTHLVTLNLVMLIVPRVRHARFWTQSSGWRGSPSSKDESLLSKTHSSSSRGARRVFFSFPLSWPPPVVWARVRKCPLHQIQSSAQASHYNWKFQCTDRTEAPLVFLWIHYTPYYEGQLIYPNSIKKHCCETIQLLLKYK